MTNIEDFEKRGALQILVTLGRSAGSDMWMVTRLWHKLGISQQAFYERLKMLKEMDLIEEVKMEGITGRHVIRLTEKGWDAARQLEKFLAAIEGRKFRPGDTPSSDQ